jgi:hypothetical protein
VTPRLTRQSVELLFEIFEQPEPVLSGAVLADMVCAEGDPLVAAGLMVPNGHEAADSSREHDDQPLDLTWLPDRQAFGYFDASRGWISVDCARLTRYRIDEQAMADALLARFGTQAGRGKSWVPETVWDLGDIRIPHRTKRVPALLVRRVHDPVSWQRIRSALLARPAANLRVLLSAAISPGTPDGVPTGNVLISLRDVIPDDGGLAINPKILAARLDHRPAPPPDEALAVIADGREVRLDGETFRFPKGEQQRRIILALHQRYLAGEHWVSSAEIIAELDLPPRARLRDYFKKTNPPAWGRLLKEENGMCGFCLRR